MRKILLMLLFVAPFLSAELYIPRRDLGNLKVSYGESGFIIHNEDENTHHVVQGYNLNKTLRDMSPQARQAFMRNGCLKVGRMSDGEYSLEMHGRLKGGGPILASVFYWLTKSCCWAGVGIAASAGVATVTAAVVASGGALAGAAVGGASVAIASTAAVTTAIGGTVGSTGAGIIGAAIVGSGSAAATAAATTGGAALVAGAAASGAGAVGLVAGIESASWAAWILGMAIPWF